MTERRDGIGLDTEPLVEPAHVSDDPGRPDNVIQGAPGAILVIISGPSGVGKDTIIDEMRRREADEGRVDERHYVVTMTTRAPRDGEVDGVDYHFVTRDEFLRIRAARGLLEANEVHGNWYGSPRDQVREALIAGRDVILKIDVQGAQKVKDQVTEALLIFIIPPSLKTLFERLRARATETADELDLRQRNAAIELARQDDYDHVVVNETGKVALTAREIEAIIAEERTAHAGRRVRV
jgi:guanylate kinase